MALKPLNSPGGFSVGEISLGAINVISSTGNVTTGNLIGSAGGNLNIIADNLLINGGNGVGNLSVGNLIATGNVQGAYILGNGSQLTGMYSNLNVANFLPTYTGSFQNLTGNVTTTANIQGQYILGNGYFLTNINAGNIVGSYGNGDVANYLASNAAVTILTTGNITTAANVSGSYLLGNIRSATGGYDDANVAAYTGALTNLTGNVTTTANVQGSYLLGNIRSATGGYDDANVAAYTGALTNLTGNVTTTANVQGAYVLGNGYFLTNINASNIVGSYGNSDVANYLASGANIRIDTLGNITTTANIAGNYLLGNGYFVTGIQYGNIAGAYGNANVKSYLESGATINANFGTGTVTTSGNISGGNIGGALVSGTLTTAAQPNITTLGTLVSLDVSANITAGGISMAQGNATIGNLYVTGNTTIAGNITQISGNSGQFFGNASTGFNALYAGLPAGFTLLPQSVMNYVTSFNGYSQVNNQNQNGGDEATVDYVLTGNNGDDETYYFDIGYTSSGFNGSIAGANNAMGTAVETNDAYMYTTANVAAGQIGNLILATVDTNSQIRFVVGGRNMGNTALRINAPNTVSANSISGTITVQGGAGINGNINASGNITGDNVTATGNVSGTYLLGNGYFITNINAGNIVGAYSNNDVANFLPTYTGALPNLTGNVTTTANVQGGYLLGNGYFITGIQYSNIAGAYGNSNVAAYLPTYTGNLASLTGNVTTTANISASYLLGNGAFITGLPAGYSNADVANYLASNAAVTILTTGNITTSGNISAGNFIGTGANTTIAAGSFSWTFDDVGNLTFPGTGNLVGGNLISANFFSGNGSLLTGMYSNLNVANYLPTYTGNVGAGNLNLTGNIVDTGAIQIVTGSSGNIGLAPDGTNTAVISTTGVSVTGVITASGNITSSGNVSGTYLLGNGAFITGLPAGYSNADVANYLASGSLTSNIITTGNVSGGNVLTTGIITATGNITGGNLSGTLVTGTLTTAAQPNITSVGTLTSLSVTGNVTSSGNVSGNYLLGNGAFITGLPAGYSNADVANYLASNAAVTILTTGNITTSANISAGNFIGTGSNTTIRSNGFSWVFDSTGNLTTPVAGTITGGNLITANFFSGDGSLLTNINAGNILGSYGNANVKAYLESGATINANFGTGTVTTSGNVNGGNLVSSANIDGTNVNATKLASSGALTLTTGSNGNIVIQPNGSGNVVLSNTFINSVAYPVQDQDAASKVYVDNLVSTAIAYHESVVAATTTTLAIATGGTITYNQPNGGSNGVGATLSTTGSFNLIDSANIQSANARILVKNEANGAHNGIYVWSNATAITRADDEDTPGVGTAFALGINDYFFVTGGNVNLGTAWIVDAPNSAIVFGTSSIQFAQFSQTQVYSANTSAGLVLVGQQFNAKTDNNTTAFDGGGNIIVKAGANLTTPNIGNATGSSLNVTGTLTGGNISTGGIITATGNISGGNLSGTLITGTLTTAAQPNITSVGTLTSLDVTGNVTSSGNVSGTYLLGNGAFITGLPAGYSNADVANYLNSAPNINILLGNSNSNITTGGTIRTYGTSIANNFVANSTVTIQSSATQAVVFDAINQTTSSATLTTLATINVTTLPADSSALEVVLRGKDGTNTQAGKIMIVWGGSDMDYSRYAEVLAGAGCGVPSASFDGTNLLIQVTPLNSNSMSWNGSITSV